MKRLSENTDQLIQQLYSPRGFLKQLQGKDHHVDVLTEIGLTGELAAVPLVAPFLAHSSVVATTAAKTIGQLLQNATPEDILYLDEQVRLAYEWGDSNQWRQLKPKDLSYLSVKNSYLAPVMGVLSCHPTGYVREEAVKKLAHIHDGSEIPYLLIRLNDWVAPVRKAAKKSVMERFASEQYSGFINNMVLVFRLTECRRDDHADVVQTVVTELVKPDGHVAIAEVLSSSSRVVRRQGYRLSMMAEGPHRPRVVHLALNRNDAVLRLWSARDARQELSDNQLENSLPLLKRDKFAPVRREALFATMERFRDRSHHALTEALLDPSVPVREFARFHLNKKEGEQDFATFYREAIESECDIAIAISGLGETGNAQDLDTLRRYLNHPASSVRQSAVRSMGLLADDSVTKTLLGLVRDESSKVSFEACRALKPRIHSVALNELMDIFRMESRCRTLRAIVGLLDSVGSWTGVPLLLEAATHPDKNVSDLARQRILARINRVFISPNSPQRADILTSLNQHGGQLPTEFVDEFRNWMRSIH